MFDIFFALSHLAPILIPTSLVKRSIIPCMRLDVTCLSGREGVFGSVIKTAKVFNIQMVVQTDLIKVSCYKTVITRSELFIWYFRSARYLLCFFDAILEAKHVRCNNIETVKVCGVVDARETLRNGLIKFSFIQAWVHQSSCDFKCIKFLYRYLLCNQRLVLLHLFQTLSVLNPFRATEKSIFEDTDLAGPLCFCLAFGGFLLLVSVLVAQKKFSPLGSFRLELVSRLRLTYD